MNQSANDEMWHQILTTHFARGQWSWEQDFEEKDHRFSETGTTNREFL